MVVPSTPRIPFERMPDPLCERLRPRVERLGYLGEFFQVAAHQPEALAGFMDFTEALKVTLPPRLVETIALTVAVQTGNDYERVQHEHLALKVGLDLDEVRALAVSELPADRFSETERSAAALARDVVAARGGRCTDRYDALEALAGPEAAVGCLMTAARYLAHATMANTWGLRPPVASPVVQEQFRV